MVIKEGTASYAAWRETPIPVYTKFYFFDMLNPQVNVTDSTIRCSIPRDPSILSEAKPRCYIYLLCVMYA